VASFQAGCWCGAGGRGGGALSVGTAEAVRLITARRGADRCQRARRYAAGHAAVRATCRWASSKVPRKCPATRLAAGAAVPFGARAGRAAALLRKAAREGGVAGGGTAAWREAASDREIGLTGACGVCAARDNCCFAASGCRMTPVKMYTTQVCPFCLRAKPCSAARRAGHRGDPHRPRPASARHGADHRPPHGAADLRRRDHVGGCDDLIALDRRGGLLPCWGPDRARAARPARPSPLLGNNRGLRFIPVRW